MPTLQDLPLSIIHHLVQHLTAWGTTAGRKDALSLSSTSKKLRDAIYESTLLTDVVMGYSKGKVDQTRRIIKLSLRKKVKTLTLKGDCAFSDKNPALRDYVELFPRLTSISFDLVYPEDTSARHRAGAHIPSINNTNTPKQPRLSPIRSVSSLKTVSLAINKSVTFHGTKHERYIAKFVSQFQASMKQVKSDRLERFHLDVATSRLKEDREDPDYWRDLGNRLKGAVVIPSRDVSLTIGEIRINGESGKFLTTLVAAIKGWPKRIERISIEVYTDDFGCDKRNRNMFKIGKKGRVTLTPGWIPTERDMEGFAAKVKKDRSNLKEVHLDILARTTVFTSEGLLSKAMFTFAYTKHNPAIALAEKTPNTIRSSHRKRRRSSISPWWMRCTRRCWNRRR